MYSSCDGGRPCHRHSLKLLFVFTIIINIFTTHITIQKSLCHSISVSPFSLTSKPVLSTFFRALWVWPSPHPSHSHKLNRTHFHLFELSPQHNKQKTKEKINIQIIIHACSLSSPLTNQYDTLRKLLQRQHRAPATLPDLSYYVPLLINPFFIHLPKLWE